MKRILPALAGGWGMATAVAGARLMSGPLKPSRSQGGTFAQLLKKRTEAGPGIDGSGRKGRVEGPAEGAEGDGETADPSLTDERGPGTRRGRVLPADPLDPLERQTAQLGPPPWPHPGGVAPPPPDAPVEARARSSLEDLLPALVRRVAWSVDGRRSFVRLELAAGAMAGAHVVVEAEAGRVRVSLSAPQGVDGEAWRARIAARLAQRGVPVDAVEVD